MRSRARSHHKSIFDPVHGPIRLDGVALALVSTPEFQRLWGIRQTGFAHLVFPGANHTRLEHSLGTYWVASEMAARLDLPASDASRVAAGSLLHDVGHGPFSHTLDSPMREVLGFGHETLSRARIEGTESEGPWEHPEVPAVLSRFRLDPRDVADLIDPRRSTRGPPLLRQILHGPIDADRIDYLQRDAYYTGVAHGAIDAVRLLDTVRAAGGRLAFAEKGRSAVEGFLVGRALMYTSVYFHKTVRAAEMMAQAAVERMPGYPESARPLFGRTDGEFLDRLQGAGGLSEALARGLLERRLYKRAFGWTTLPGPTRARWERLLGRPAERRALEDEIASGVRRPAGSVLIDLAMLDTRDAPEDDWGEIGLLTGEGTLFPFRRPSPWRTLAARPPSEWAVSVYAAPRAVSDVARYVARDPRALP
ncbi:MAG TPA: HD domain-containing protein [Thermoplasmata archaeon]|nr:HD domain-containing protein [Thermoplasmata archaeon]